QKQCHERCDKRDRSRYSNRPGYTLENGSGCLTIGVHIRRAGTMWDDQQSSAGEWATVLSMETLKNFVWPIVAIGGLGAFIDFLIGKAGQERAKDFLLRWWVRFDDVHWKNFGREEGLFSRRLIETICGRRVWSLRRITVAILILPVFTLFAVLKMLAFG